MTGPARDAELGQALKVARVNANLSQAHVAHRMRERGWRWNQSAVSDVERGAKSLRLAEALDLSEILRTPLAVFADEGTPRARGLGPGVAILMPDAPYPDADADRLGRALVALRWLEVERLLLALGAHVEALDPLEEAHASVVGLETNAERTTAVPSDDDTSIERFGRAVLAALAQGTDPTQPHNGVSHE